jgi:hypothetical protein
MVVISESSPVNQFWTDETGNRFLFFVTFLLLCMLIYFHSNNTLPDEPQKKD